MEPDREITLACPVPFAEGQKIQLAHGGGGRLMHRLLDDVILPALRKDQLAELHDCALVPTPATTRLAFTTDSYVVRPLFFPGGDIGTLAVNGTVNDLAMGGARPVWLSAGFILEEGLPWEILRRVCQSLRQAADAAGVSIVTGDTKVVERGKGDGIFINTSGIGVVEHGLPLGPRQVRPGDAILLSGDVGRHGIALMAVREGIRLETALESDCAPLAQPVRRLVDADVPIHCLRDLTRGGLASALVEIAEASALAIQVHEDRIPVHDTVRAVCEILGLDALHVANEGRFVAFVPSEHAERALEILHGDPLGTDARQIGNVEAGEPGRVTLRSSFGTTRILDMLSGEQLPRIC
ncbi:MAG: hydrogenase expression/formation protein HypE [Planctomycetes bacterium]|nr:hydrogenase expression/formation protein HypE [Planctomycetota bacterium]